MFGLSHIEFNTRDCHLNFLINPKLIWNDTKKSYVAKNKLKNSILFYELTQEITVGCWCRNDLFLV